MLSESARDQSPKGSTTRALLLALLFLIVALVGVAIGVWVGRLLPEKGWINALLLVAGALLLAWSAVLALAFAPSALKYVRCGTLPPQLPIALASPILVGTLAIIGLGAFGARTASGGLRSSVTLVSTFIPVPSETETQTPTPTPTTEMALEPARDFFMVPFYTDEGSSKTCSDEDPAFGNAQNVHEGSLPTLKILVDGLAQCAANGKSPEIDIRGFASSSGFRSCASQEESESLNLLLAERRRAAVVRAVRQFDPLKTIRVYQEDEARRWPTIEEMRRNIRIVDWDANGYSSTRGNLSRRAEIVITNKGDCEETVARTAEESPTERAER